VKVWLAFAERARSALRWWLAVSLAVVSMHAFADAGQGPGLKPDLRLLIDISGSMKESDPDNLRAPALDLIVRLLPEGSRAGVWIFGEEVELIVPHRVIDDEWRRQAQEAVNAIDNSGQRTNIPAALAAATYDIDRMEPGFRPSIVLLTDGKVDVTESPMANAKAARALLSEVAPNLGATGIAVHTIALSDEADWVFLRSLARNTSGLAEKAESAGELSEIFLQSLEMVAPTARVPVKGRSFQIDDSVEEFTALVFFDEKQAKVGLISPSGERYRPAESPDNVAWFSNRQFALVTVRQPAVGEWKLVAPEGVRTRVTVMSDLHLEVDPLPNSLPAGRQAELGLRLLNKGEVIRDPEVLGLFEVSVIVKGPRETEVSIDVSAGYPLPEDGEYRITVPPFVEPGRYEVLATVAAETLRRELPMYVDVSATPASSTLVTKGEEVPEEDLNTPLMTLAAVVLVAAVVIYLLLHRRRRRKLELWERRSRSGEAGPDEGELLEGVSAEHEPDSRP
jgi:hypothetical protein